MFDPIKLADTQNIPQNKVKESGESKETRKTLIEQGSKHLHAGVGHHKTWAEICINSWATDVIKTATVILTKLIILSKHFHSSHIPGIKNSTYATNKNEMGVFKVIVDCRGQAQPFPLWVIVLIPVVIFIIKRYLF